MKNFYMSFPWWVWVLLGFLADVAVETMLEYTSSGSLLVISSLFAVLVLLWRSVDRSHLPTSRFVILSWAESSQTAKPLLLAAMSCLVVMVVCH